MRKTILFLIVVFSIASAQDVLTIEQAVSIGLENNFNIRILRNNAAIAENNRGKGTAAFLPSLDAISGIQHTSTNQDSNSPSALGDTESGILTGQLALSWTLFDGFKMFADMNRYKLLAEMGEYQARYGIESTVVAIMRAYYNLVQQNQILKASRKSLGISEVRLEKARIRNDLGGASTTDLLNARVLYNNDQSALFNQELNVEIAAKNLNLLLGRDPTTAVMVEEEIQIPVLDLNEINIFDEARQANNLLLMAERNHRIANQNVKTARSVLFPRIGLAASYGYNQLDYYKTMDLYTKTTTATAGLNLSFNIFNGFKHKIDLQNAKIDLKNAQLSLQNQELELRGSVKEKFLAYQKGLKLVRLEEENVVAAEQNLNLMEEKYNTGSTSSLEFRDAQLLFLRSQTSLISAKYQVRMNQLELEQLMGKIRIK